MIPSASLPVTQIPSLSSLDSARDDSPHAVILRHQHTRLSHVRLIPSASLRIDSARDVESQADPFGLLRMNGVEAIVRLSGVEA
jgi:hypothetical protein